MRFDWLAGTSNAAEPLRGDLTAKFLNVSTCSSEDIPQSGSKKVRCKSIMLSVLVDLI